MCSSPHLSEDADAEETATWVRKAGRKGTRGHRRRTTLPSPRRSRDRRLPAGSTSDHHTPTLLAYATTKGAIANFTAGLAQLLGPEGIRVDAVAPGPVWTPLIPSTMSAEKAAKFGADTPLGRPAQPAELAPAYVFLASNDATYIAGAVLAILFRPTPTAATRQASRGGARALMQLPWT